MSEHEPRPLYSRGNAQAAFKAFPPAVQREMGYGLFLAQMGERHPGLAKTLGGFGGGAVIELRQSRDGNAFRAVYSVRFADAVYVLHAFQKKSKSGIATPRTEIETVRRRLAELISERERHR